MEEANETNEGLGNEQVAVKSETNILEYDDLDDIEEGLFQDDDNDDSSVEGGTGKPLNSDSIQRYKKKWDLFIKTIKPESKPTEQDFLKFMKHLVTNKNLSRSTLMTLFSILQYFYRKLYESNFDNFKRIPSSKKGFQR